MAAPRKSRNMKGSWESESWVESRVPSPRSWACPPSGEAEPPPAGLGAAVDPLPVGVLHQVELNQPFGPLGRGPAQLEPDARPAHGAARVTVVAPGRRKSSGATVRSALRPRVRKSGTAR